MPTIRAIGGYKIYGGWISQADISDTISGLQKPGQDSFVFSGYPQRRIPIRECRFIEQYNERPLFVAGLLGKPTMRRVSLQSQFAFSIWFDYDNPIEVAANGGGAGATPSFRQRDPFQLCFLAGYDYISQQYAKAYYAPRCTAEIITPIWDNESQPKKVIGMEVTGRSRAWDFILPDDCLPSNDPTDNTTIVGAYLKYLNANGGLV